MQCAYNSSAIMYDYIHKVGDSDNKQSDKCCYVNKIPMGENIEKRL